MSKLIKTFLLFLLIILSLNTAYSNEKTAFVDLDYLVKNSKVGKLALKKINELDKKNLSKLKSKNEELKKIEIELQKKQNIISEEAFKEEVNSLKMKINEFSIEKNEMVKNFNSFKKKELDIVFAKISPVIKEFMNKNSINVLLDTKNVFMGKQESDLTKEILNEINKSIK